MKMLTVSLLVCAMMAVTRVAAVSGAKADATTGSSTQEEREIHLVKELTPCPSGWTKFSGRCFIYVPTKMTWANAEKHCQSHGGNLVSVHNSDERNVIQNIITALDESYPLTWLGGTDAQQEGTWFWSDGTPFNFSYWSPGQPDNRASAHCLLMNFGDERKFDDQPCSYMKPFVCSKVSLEDKATCSAARNGKTYIDVRLVVY